VGSHETPPVDRGGTRQFGKERLGQGRENVRQRLLEEPELMAKLRAGVLGGGAEAA
jgi:hypothetical protein